MASKGKVSTFNELLANDDDTESTISEVTTQFLSPGSRKTIHGEEVRTPRSNNSVQIEYHIQSPPKRYRRTIEKLSFELNKDDSQSLETRKTSICSTDQSRTSQSFALSDRTPKSFNSPKTSNSKKNLISVDELLSEDPPLRNTIIFLVLLRVVATNQNSDNNFYSVKSFKKKNYNESKCAYTRLFLCMDLNSPTGQTVYIGEGRGIGMNLWSRIASVRDNGISGVGSIFALHSPRPITKMLANEIPILETNSSLQLVKRESLQEISIDTGVPENLTRGFVLNKCSVEIVSAEVLATACSGLFCDRQRTLELLRTGKKCGCYFMRSIASNLSIVHTIKIQEENEEAEALKIEEFSSFKFSRLYLTEYFPKSTQRISFDAGSNNMEALYTSMDNVINFYNENGGFTIVGWYKRGEINDSVQTENEKVTSSIMNYHVTSIYPTQYINHEARQTEQMKFDILDIE